MREGKKEKDVTMLHFVIRIINENLSDHYKATDDLKLIGLISSWPQNYKINYEFNKYLNWGIKTARHHLDLPLLPQTVPL